MGFDLRRLVSKGLTRVLFGLIRPEDLEEQLLRLNTDSSRRQSTLGFGSSFHHDSWVENLTQDSTLLRIGRQSVIRGELTVYPGAEGLVIGDYCYIGRWSVIRANQRVVIGNRVLISHHVTILDSDGHPLDSTQRAQEFLHLVTQGHLNDSAVNAKPVQIDDDAWISCNATILKGVHVGRGAIVAAGAVVTKDVPPFTLVAGNPATVMKSNLT